MRDVDPYAVLRNPATLAAYRQHHRAVRRAARPWIALAVVLAALMVSSAVYALFHAGFRRSFMFLAVPSLAAGVGLASGIAGLRMAAYRRDHPAAPPGGLRCRQPSQAPPP